MKSPLSWALHHALKPYLVQSTLSRYKRLLDGTHKGNPDLQSQLCGPQPAPVPPKRDLVKLPPPLKVALHSEGRFTVLSYNILADLYATVRLHPFLS